MRAICPTCGKVFDKPAPASRYCSKRCREHAKYLRERVRQTMPDIPKEAFNLFDAFSRLRYVESDFARLGAVGDARTRAIALRVTEAIADILDEEGML
jgi:hypothetical protein